MDSPNTRTIDLVHGTLLNKINKERELEDTPSIRGMIEKVKHLVVIKEN